MLPPPAVLGGIIASRLRYFSSCPVFRSRFLFFHISSVMFPKQPHRFYSQSWNYTKLFPVPKIFSWCESKNSSPTVVARQRPAFPERERQNSKFACNFFGGTNIRRYFGGFAVDVFVVVKTMHVVSQRLRRQTIFMPPRHVFTLSTV